ncbi:MULTISPECIES: hypothetical protein [Nitrosomonas]|nr:MULTISPECIES: hypothetical protein [Nitrosomonas]UVS62551.1 hypothetical protein NX761_05360 [Nitrosomonas sp. PLL12]
MNKFFSELANFGIEINAAVNAFNFNATNSTSTTSLAIGTGNKSLTVQASKSYVAGMTVRVANSADVTKWMQGEVVSYNSSTGALVVNVTHIAGSGTIATWTISQASPILLPFQGTEKVVVYTSNAYASTDTSIMRFATIQTNLGASITYADNAANGGRFTINASGLYHVNLMVDYVNTNGECGVSLNSANLATAFSSIPQSEKLIFAGGGAQATGSGPTGNGYTGWLASGSVLRAHGDNLATGVKMIVERLF